MHSEDSIASFLLRSDCVTQRRDIEVLIARTLECSFIWKEDCRRGNELSWAPNPR